MIVQRDDEEGFAIYSQGPMETFFKHPSSELNTVIKTSLEIEPKKRRAFIDIFFGIKRLEKGTTVNERLVLAKHLTEFNFKSFESYRFLNQMNLNPEEIGGEKASSWYLYDIPIGNIDRDHYITALNWSYSKKSFEFFLSLPKENLLILKDQINNEWDNYVVRKGNWNTNYGKSSQQQYGSWIHDCALFGVKKLKDKEWGFVDLLDFFAQMRQTIGVRLQHPEWQRIGIPREQEVLTLCTGPYEALGEKLWGLKQDLILHPDMYRLEIEKGALQIIGENILQFRGKINDEWIDLSKIEFPPDFKESNQPTTRTYCPKVHHTPAENIKKILSWIETTLYPQLMQETNPEKINKLLGEIFWLLCQAKPWELGDPSIAELFFRTILLFKDCESCPWKEDLVPWVEVTLESDPHQFAKNFPYYFARKIKAS